MSTTPPGSTPAGWYPDTNQPGTLRYWDGNAWTEHTHAGQAAQPGMQPGMPGQQGTGYQTYAPGMTSPPNNHLVMAILTTIFCCLPFGIVSIVKAAQVNNLWSSGQYDAARTAAGDAKKWWMISAGVGVAVFVLYFGFVIAVGVGSTTTY